MALSPAKQRYLRRSQENAAAMLELLGRLAQNNTLSYGAPDYVNTITQEDIDESGVFPGLTVAIMQANESALATIYAQINAALTALSEGAGY